MVAGGYGDASSTSEILDLSTMQWRPGPDIPKEAKYNLRRGIYGMSSFQYGDTFGLAGGYDTRFKRYTDTILMFDPEVSPP